MKSDLDIMKFGISSHAPKFWFSNLKQFFRNLKFARQRIKRGYADCDTWEMDAFLSVLISEMLIDLSQNSHGCPYGKDEEGWKQELLNAAFDLYDACYDSDESLDELDNLLDGIAIAKAVGAQGEIEQYRKEYCENLLQNENLREQSKDRALDWLKANWYNLWD